MAAYFKFKTAADLAAAAGPHPALAAVRAELDRLEQKYA